MAQLQQTGITGSLNIFGSVTASAGFFGMTSSGSVGSSGPAVTYITSSNPPGNVNPSTVGTLWLNASSNELFTCVTNEINRNDWGGTSGSRLYYGKALSSSLSTLVPGISSGSIITASVVLFDTYGVRLRRDPVQNVTFTGSNTTTATTVGIYSGSTSGVYNGTFTTANYSGSVTITGSIDGTNIPNFITIPVSFPKQVYGFGTGTHAVFNATSTSITSGSGGPQRIDTVAHYISASCGSDFCIYLTADGRLFSRGLNNVGQCGVGNITSPVPTLTQIGVTTGPWKIISAGDSHTCAINTNNQMFCWGSNNLYQLGLGTNATTTTPTRETTNSTWLDVSCGTNYTLAVKTDNTLWGAGNNGGVNISGSLGNPPASQFVRIGTDANWAKVFAGYLTSHAIKTTGTLWGWGTNSSYQIGDGTTTQRGTPTQVGAATDWTFVTGERLEGFVKIGLRGNAVYGWGYNVRNALTSQSAGSYVTTPTLLIPIQAKAIAQNYYATYIIDTGSGLQGWGHNTISTNQYGQFLGYGMINGAAWDTSTTYNSPLPGVVQRMSSIYTHDTVSALQNNSGMVTTARILTGSGAPTGSPSNVTISVFNSNNSVQVNWINGDSLAETRVTIASGSLTQPHFVRPGATRVYIRPSAATGSVTTAQLRHIKNELFSAGGVTSSAVSFCPPAYSVLISNECNGNGQRETLYSNGSCGTISTGLYCDLSCGGYTYQGTSYFTDDYCGCGPINAPFNRYTNGTCTAYEPLFDCCQDYGCGC
jgi:alpha-tubulin suppressor-like RCC1 family protein